MSRKSRRCALQVGLAVATIVAALAGCKDELASPTQGFIEVDTAGVESVEVFLDGVLRGVDATRIGPLDQGSYRVSVSRDGFESTPALGIDVDVQPGRTSPAKFTLVAVLFGSIDVRATDELTLAEITGAQILLRDGSDFVSTGLVTPAVIDDVPLGPADVRVQSPDHADVTVQVDVARGDTASVAPELGPFRKVLAEMFTYVICPNCPEAADSLQSLQATQTGRVFVIEWHTWWDSPALPLGDERWKDREDMYTGGVDPGWPAVVVQGGYADDPALLIGSQNAELVEYRLRTDAYLAECEDDCEYALATEGDVTTGTTNLLTRLKWRNGPGRADLRLRVVLIEGDVEAPGNDSPYHYVPRDIHETVVPFTTPGEISEIPSSFSVDPSWDVSHMDYVAYLQSDATLEILAVDGSS